MPDPSPPSSDDAPRPTVLVVGQASAGGIGTYLRHLVDDPWLQRHVRLELLDTTIPSHIRPGALNLANVRLALQQARRVYRRGRGADVVHLNMAAAPNLPLLRAVTLSAVAKRSGARVVLHTHSGYVEHAVRRRTYRLLLRLALRVADRFVVNSRANEAALRRVGAQVLRIDNGIDPEPFRMGPKDDDPPVVSFVGTVAARKGLIELRDALRALWPAGELPVRVLIAGDGRQEGPGAFDRVKQAFDDAGLHDVTFLGALDTDEVADLLARSTVFCLPSHWETFPLAILEAMAAGAVVVATDVGDTRFILDDGNAGYVIPAHDVDALAKALDRALADEDARERMVEAARSRVQERFRADIMIRELHRLYLDAAGY